jgi:hypothetical protein
MNELEKCREARMNQGLLHLQLRISMKNLQCRVDWLTEKLYKYAEEVLRRDALIARLEDQNKEYEKRLFDAAGYITAVKDPTMWGMQFAGDIYRIVSEKYFPSYDYRMEELKRKHDEEDKIGLAATVLARTGEK